MPGEPRPGDVPAAGVPAGDAPVARVPGGDALVAGVPGGDAPAGDVSAGDAPGGDAPAGAVRARPERLRRLCALVAGVLVLVSGVVTLLSGRASNGSTFGAPDRIALFCLGLLIAGGVLLLGRPAVAADDRGLRVRNLGGEREVPWALVRGISVRGRSPWATLDLVDDEAVPLLAVQVLDGERAVATVRALRALRARYGPGE